MKRKPRLVILILVVLLEAGRLFATEPTSGDAEPAVTEGMETQGLIQLESSHLELDASTWQARAVGDVTIRHQGITLHADEVFLDVEKEESYAKGRVRLLHGEDILTCDAISFHWEDQTGSVENGDLFVAETGYHVWAGKMEKTGLDTYGIEQGTFTTCDCPSPEARRPWDVRAEEAELTLGGYAKLRKATFRVFRIPVFYLPRGYLPVKLQRESGFLVPRISQSGANGWGVAFPFFWAVDASKDATLTLEGLTKRGVKPSVEVRYRPRWQTQGQWDLSCFQDLDDERVRYGVKGVHRQRLSSFFYDKLDLNLVSDNSYVEDFPGEVGSTADRLLESRGAIGYRSDLLHVAVESVYSDLVERAGGEEIAQRGPQILASIVRYPVGFPGLSFSWFSESTYFFNESGDERVRSQYLPKGHLLVNLLPGLTLQGHAGVREVLSSGSVGPFTREPVDPSGALLSETRHRTLAEAGAEVQGRLSRGYRWGHYRLHHFLQPQVAYQYVRKVEGDTLPVVMDGLDDLQRRNWVTCSLRTSLWGKRTEGSGLGSEQGLLAEAFVVQSLDMERDAQDSPDRRLFSDILTALLVHPRPFLSVAANFQVDPDEGALRVVETGVSARERKNRYGVYVGYIRHESHRVDPLSRVELVDVYDRDYDFPGIGHTLRTRLDAKVMDRVTTSLDTLYLVEPGKVENHLSVIYLSKCKCWSIILKLRNTVRPDEFGFSVRFRLEGLGETL